MKVIIELHSMCSIENLEDSESEVKINISDYTAVVKIEDLKSALRKMTAK